MSGVVPPGRQPKAAPRPASRNSGLAWKAALGLLISAVLLWYAFRNEDPAEIAHEISRADPWLLLLAVAAATFVFWIRAWRWRSILDPVRPGTTFRARFAAVNIGFMGNNLLPLRVGEFARAYALSRLEPVPLVAAFSTLVLERLFDGVMLVLFLFISMALPGFPELRIGEAAQFTAVARGLAVLVAGAMLVLFLLVLFPARAVRVLERVVLVLPAALRRPIVDALEAFLAGVSILRDPVLLGRATLWSIVLWLVNALGFYLGMLAFDIDLPYVAAVFLQSCVALAVSVPSAPGFFGPFEAATSVVLVDMWGTDASKALGFALGFHIAGFFPVTLMGLFYAGRMGLSLRGMARSEEMVETAVERESGVDPDDPDAARDRSAAP
jgi:uncharacterized protein (TIRG00374 family)